MAHSYMVNRPLLMGFPRQRGDFYLARRPFLHIFGFILDSFLSFRAADAIKLCAVLSCAPLMPGRDRTLVIILRVPLS